MLTIGAYLAILSLMENWKDIPFIGYSVSDQGRVASRKRGGWRVLRPGRQAGKYFIVGLCLGSRQRSASVHRLVAESFLPKRPTPQHVINHKDGDKANNRADNLEWVTPSENTKHYWGMVRSGLEKN